MAVKLGNGKWAVKENNLLAYNDNSGQFFNKEFDFTRGSSATYVGKDGLIKTAGLQDTNLVQNGDFSELGSELVTNGDFATDSNWNTSSTGISISGGKLSRDATATTNIIQINSTIKPSVPYQITFEIVDYTSGTLRPRFGYNGSGGTNVYGVGVYTQTITKLDQDVIELYGPSFIGSIDNVSVKQVDPNDEWTFNTGWSIEDGKAISNTSSGYVNINQTTSIAINKSYKVSFTLSDYSSGEVQFIIGNAGSRPSGVLRSVNGTYTEYITVDSSTVDADKFFIRGGASGFSGSISNISVQEIQVNTPRIDFSDSADGALLLEPQRTNLIEYSNAIQSIGFNEINTSIQAEWDFTSPDGTINADLIRENTANDTHFLFKDFNLTSGQTYSISVFAKKNGTNRNLRFGDGGVGWSSGFNVNFDLTNGSASSGGVIESYGNGWYRCSVVGTTNATTSRLLVYSILNTSTTYEGDGSSGLFLYGLQLEQGSYATSYIPTQGSASTRIAETCNNSGSAQDFNSEEGVLYAEIAALSGSGGFRAISLNDGGENNRVMIIYEPTENNIYFFTIKGGVIQSEIGVVLNNSSYFNKLALSWKTNEVKSFVNGVQVGVTDTSATPPIGLNTLSFNDGNNNELYGNVKQIQVFTEALSDEELEKLTTI